MRISAHGGTLVLPSMKDAGGNTRHLAIGAGKDSNIYIVNLTKMGKFNPNSQRHLSGDRRSSWRRDVGHASIFQGNVYFGPQSNQLLRFRFSNAKLSTLPVSKSSASFPFRGTTPSVSANGVTNGIIWAIEHTDPNNVLHAYDATSLERELYNSGQAPNARDAFGQAGHFGTPLIVNGKVYVGTTTNVAVFGLLK